MQYSQSVRARDSGIMGKNLNESSISNIDGSGVEGSPTDDDAVNQTVITDIPNATTFGNDKLNETNATIQNFLDHQAFGSQNLAGTSASAGNLATSQELDGTVLEVDLLKGGDQTLLADQTVVMGSGAGKQIDATDLSLGTVAGAPAPVSADAKVEEES